MKFVGLQLCVLGRGCYKSRRSLERTKDHKWKQAYSHIKISTVALPADSDSVCSGISVASLQDHFILTDSLLWWLNISPLEGINYWAVQHHRGVWLGTGAKEGSGWLFGCSPVLDVEHRGVPGLESPQPSSRAALQGLAKGSPGWMSKQLPPWLQPGSQNTPHLFSCSRDRFAKQCCLPINNFSH